MNEITNRILNKIGNPELTEKMASLSQSDLNTLLLEIMKQKNISPPNMLKSYALNRFCVPSGCDAIDYHKYEIMLLELAKSVGIKSVMLSPVAPFGNCSTFGCVDQNNIVSALRGTEVLADPTNMLATIIADKIKNKALDNSTAAHFCTTARTTRTQPLLSKNHFAHFGIFCIVSTAKDTGSYLSEKEILLKQLEYYKLLLLEKYHAKMSVTLRKRGGYTDTDGFFQRMSELIQTELPDTPFDFDLDHEDNNYYKGINFKIYMEKDGETLEIGDGGFVDWTQQMLCNKRERLLISGIGIERIMML
ncbi:MULTISPECIES: hypothetical protein [unclassified Clostridioides]|uniref:hypothetical protein n=1 Tax=unclassified Clostridioides TaxID=2635829 RepID=UPI001D0C9FC7|nr:hypothetical protein [Clostridioides sp. ES-S-0001-02]MCC0650969.1 hypothetical protein [Clostridioides sp. ES-S-0001-03]MCC0764194.1 hypothetical protein [Clostridioides sp. ES-S-0006-03]